MDLFLRMNGKLIKFPHNKTIEMMVKVATSEINLEKLSDWLKGL